jgi:hypothetical protein
MKVYVVLYSYYEGSDLEAVFATEDAARCWCDSQNDRCRTSWSSGYRYEEMEVEE